jgi:hypothetical protein
MCLAWKTHAFCTVFCRLKTTEHTMPVNYNFVLLSHARRAYTSHGAQLRAAARMVEDAAFALAGESTKETVSWLILMAADLDRIGISLRAVPCTAANNAVRNS